MRLPNAAVSAGLKGLAIGVVAIALAGCSLPSMRRSPHITRYVAPLTVTALPDQVEPEPTAVEVRNFPYRPHVEVVSWTTTDWEFGLRAVLRRDGALVRDHRLYVSTYALAVRPRFSRAFTDEHPLVLIGLSRDDHACDGGTSCIPVETFGARIPDADLRAGNDKVTVKFISRQGNELQVTLYRDLIDAYLVAVDSVSAKLRKP